MVEGTERFERLYVSDRTGGLFYDDKVFYGPMLQLYKNLNGANDGISTTNLYIGSWGSYFNWHPEDKDLPAANYLHSGAPKVNII